MPSPFPGMNPFLEQEDVWHDFHQSWIPQAREALSGQVEPSYIVKVEAHIYIHEPEPGGRSLLGRPDVAITRPGGGRVAAGAALMEAPAYGRVPQPADIERLAYLEIRDRRGRELITVIELLSPTNKRIGPDREQYLAKRGQILASGVHLVEIDLLRGGPRMPLDDLPACDYYAMVARADEYPRAGIWPIRLRDPLPAIPIPLRAPDRDALLDLRAALDRVYDAARYAHYIYDGSPQPPLGPEDAEWARRVVAEAT